MKMSKKMISAMLAAAMCVSLTAPAWASGKEEITLDTVITEENMYDVFEYLDFTPEHIEKTDRVATRQYTVRDLQYLLLLCDSISEDDFNEGVIIAVPDENTEIAPLATTGLKSVSAPDNMLKDHLVDITVEYYATGEYYCNGGECYWTRAIPNTILLKRNNSEYTVDIEILSMSAAAYGMGSTESSYIKMLSNYDVTISMIVQGVIFVANTYEQRGKEAIFRAADWL